MLRWPQPTYMSRRRDVAFIFNLIIFNWFRSVTIWRFFYLFHSLDRGHRPSQLFARFDSWCSVKAHHHHHHHFAQFDLQIHHDSPIRSFTRSRSRCSTNGRKINTRKAPECKLKLIIDSYMAKHKAQAQSTSKLCNVDCLRVRQRSDFVCKYCFLFCFLVHFAFSPFLFHNK